MKEALSNVMKKFDVGDGDSIDHGVIEEEKDADDFTL